MKNLVVALVAVLVSAAPARADVITLDFSGAVGVNSFSGAWSWDSGQSAVRFGDFYDSVVSLSRFAWNSEELIRTPAEARNSYLRMSSSSLFFDGSLPTIQIPGSNVQPIELFGWITLTPEFLGEPPFGIPQNLDFVGAVTDSHSSFRTIGVGPSPWDPGTSPTLTLGAPPAPVPEPGTLALVGLGLGGLVARYRRRQLAS